MIEHLFSKISIKQSDKNYRRLIAARFAILFAYSVISFFALYNFFDGNQKLFIFDASALFFVLAASFIYRKKSIYFIAQSLLVIMLVAMLLLVYINKGQDGTLFWSFIVVYFIMTLFGHKKGAIISIALFSLLVLITTQEIDNSISYQGFARYLIAIFVMITVAFSYEYSINKTINKLDDANIALEKMTRVDGLTTLYNRRYFNELFPIKINDSSRNENLLVFAMIDVDFFKSYNDAYGHQAGDDVLKLISVEFKKVMKRANDYAFRLGGEEFGLLFEVKERQQAINIVENILERVENLKIIHSHSAVSQYITVSIGLYIAQEKEQSQDDSRYKLCDNALYKAKNTGRNKFICHS